MEVKEIHENPIMPEESPIHFKNPHIIEQEENDTGNIMEMMFRIMKEMHEESICERAESKKKIQEMKISHAEFKEQIKKDRNEFRKELLELKKEQQGMWGQNKEEIMEINSDINQSQEFSEIEKGKSQENNVKANDIEVEKTQIEKQSTIEIVQKVIVWEVEKKKDSNIKIVEEVEQKLDKEKQEVQITDIKKEIKQEPCKQVLKYSRRYFEIENINDQRGKYRRLYNINKRYLKCKSRKRKQVRILGNVRKHLKYCIQQMINSKFTRLPNEIKIILIMSY